ncbi:MAG TPA: hypothetical protein VF209_01000 [Patescibacteria group bacterium]
MLIRFLRSIKKVTGNSFRSFGHILLFSTSIIPLFLGIFLLWYFQGKFFISKVKLPEAYKHDTSHVFVIRVLDGLKIHTFNIMRQGKERTKTFSFCPNEMVAGKVIRSSDQSEKKLIALWGKDSSPGEVLILVLYENGKFKYIPHYAGSFVDEIIFGGTKLLLENVDDDPEPEVIEAILLTAEDSSQVWDKARYDYDLTKGMFTRTSITHDPVL